MMTTASTLTRQLLEELIYITIRCIQEYEEWSLQILGDAKGDGAGDFITILRFYNNAMKCDFVYTASTANNFDNQYNPVLSRTILRPNLGRKRRGNKILAALEF